MVILKKSKVDDPGGKKTRGGEKFDKRRKFAESIASQHPDVARIDGNMTDGIIMWITTDTNKNLF